MNFSVETIFGTYSGSINLQNDIVEVIDVYSQKSMQLTIAHFEGPNPSQDLVDGFGVGARGIHIEVCKLIESIEKQKDGKFGFIQSFLNSDIIRRLNSFFAEHQFLMFFLTVVGLVLGFIGLM
ncbi:hypothetical protein DXV75_06020 [Alteromonas aestuariivivens]|uniref:Uncharacterized protein n=1 Tax=Alteromonas aestuariivivens TaxID=1938339 RepID=A0A3D8MC60_9ALTE|nr:hypothetical protein [Alteromonas aestuariivivens]RDV27579.1 hypothetical protein DXV75_06020 [Alteromonas aestuariivivens]